MNTKTDIQEEIKESLIQVLDKINEKDCGYEKLLVLYFEIALVRFAKINHAMPNDKNTWECMEKLKEKFEGILQTDLFELSKHKTIKKNIIDMLAIHFDVMIEKYSLNIYDIGRLFESLFNMEYSDSQIKETTGRSDSGMFFSDVDLVRETINLLLENVSAAKVKNSTFIDPAMGAGIFLFELAEKVKSKMSKKDFTHFLKNNVYGIDKNPIIVDLFKVCFWIKYFNEMDEMNFLGKNFVSDDSLLLPIGNNENEKTWGSIFPRAFKEGGFDYVIGNPPWGKIKANIREYNLLNGNNTKEYQGIRLKHFIEENSDKKGWKEYQQYIKNYSKALKESPNFSHQQYIVENTKTGGDFDLYKYFVELSYKLLKINGRLGYIIPASFYMSEGATALRHLLLENGDIEYLLNFENKKHIFPIHPSFKFIILVYVKKSVPGKIKKAYFDLSNVDEIKENNILKLNFISYSRKLLKLCSNDYWAIPECKSVTELNILEKLYKKYPNLGKEQKGKWKVSFKRELDMTMDSDKFVKEDELQENKRYLPLYEGRMVHQYNSSKKVYIRGTGRTALWEKNKNNKEGVIQPQYYVEEDRCRNIPQIFRASYCDVTGQKNVRTILASLIKERAVCGNKVPTCEFYPSNDITFHLYWISLANSFIIDWMMRKKMTITLNFYHWFQIPFPKLASTDKSFKCLVAWSALVLEKMNGYKLLSYISDKEIVDIYYANANENIWKLRLKIDRLVTDIFGLNSTEIACILYGFPSLDSNEEGILGDKRYGTTRKASYVTRDYLLSEVREKENSDNDISIVDIYSSIGIDIKEETGSITNLNERIEFYRKNGIVPYNE
ncbi:N-6 DNA methylase [Blautia pseudococcoides]|uniref:Eco57I restriction-modification methylase domain-containing protein n=1 Tax=Blautia pseudococcoides TaxID=1796616 RepID=UPI00148B2A3E|nr:N-6 DNA methylase [Blautia pseudococcoides]QJU16823.1 N-6 DNA methylase [Blautia pseudococcoides]